MPTASVKQRWLAKWISDDRKQEATRIGENDNADDDGQRFVEKRDRIDDGTATRWLAAGRVTPNDVGRPKAKLSNDLVRVWGKSKINTRSAAG